MKRKSQESAKSAYSFHFFSTSYGRQKSNILFSAVLGRERVGRNGALDTQKNTRFYSLVPEPAHHEQHYECHVLLKISGCFIISLSWAKKSVNHFQTFFPNSCVENLSACLAGAVQVPLDCVPAQTYFALLRSEQEVMTSQG